MERNHRDPVDHYRTTHQHAGETFIDGYCWPGLLSIALGVISLAGCVASVAYNHREYTMTTGVVAVLAIVFGILWIVLEHRRVRHMDIRWLAEHSDQGVRAGASTPNRG
ncbi:protein UsfY [Mycolicibacterium gadium]|uniref:UsfY protein n=1 Tax=Mycolicibacterium gadium TaxID=1794 RepID=A0A7I7WU42_MYCGU|nr:protein UsfY [Mycolicibacterium gadium]BBZ20267.1 hypothetical protein MGAD_46020 [Mycolicibacterium gadium]